MIRMIYSQNDPSQTLMLAVYATFQPAKFVSSFQKLLATSIQIFDIWGSSLDIMDDFKLIFRMVIFRFSEK